MHLVRLRLGRVHTLTYPQIYRIGNEMGWHKITDELPEFDTEVFIATKDGKRHLATIFEDEDETIAWGNGSEYGELSEIVAWMPVSADL